MLTLEKLGIPNFSREEYLALPFLEQVSVYHQIRKNGLTVDSPVDEIICGMIVFNYKMFDKDGEIATFLERKPTYREYVDFVEKASDDKLVIQGDIKKVTGWGNGPYFTNNFFANFPNEGYRVEFPNTENEVRLKLWQRLDSLLSGETLDNILKKNSLKDVRNWDGQRAIYPYYIQLVMEGFEHKDLGS